MFEVTGDVRHEGRPVRAEDARKQLLPLRMCFRYPVSHLHDDNRLHDDCAKAAPA